MKKMKIGAIFIISILALAGIGISYAGFFDTIYVYGTVDTATVDLTVKDYSGTDVWKVWMNNGTPPPDPYEDEVFIWRGFFNDRLSMQDVLNETNADNALLVASAWASEGDNYDVDMVWDNVFPCIDFVADLIIHYDGSIPAKIGLPTIIWRLGDDLSQFITFEAYEYSWDEGTQAWIPGEEILEWPFQMHYCEYIGFQVIIHIPQDNRLQDKHGEFSFDINAIQWNDECGDTDLTLIKTVDNPVPLIGTNITYTVKVQNNGPAAATNVVVLEDIPQEITYISHITTMGTYNHITGLWDIGNLAVSEVAQLDITGTVNSQGTQQGNIQVGMILDGSGSIYPSNWTTMKNGLAAAILDNSIFPDDGTVELTVVQFSYDATVEIPPTVITAANKAGIAATIQAMVQKGSVTDMGAGFITCANAMIGGPYFNPSNRQVINLVTDGYPYTGYPNATQEAIDGRNYLIAQLGMTSGQDEIDAEGIGYGVDINFLKDNMVYPQPGNLAPPFIPGWVYPIDTYTEFANAIGEKFTVIFTGIENCAAIISQTPPDLNLQDNTACVTITPQPCAPPEFTTLDLETSTNLSTWSDVYYDTINDWFVLYTVGSPGINHYLTLGTDTATNIPLAAGFYDFYLTDIANLSTGFWSYWNTSGVNANSTPGTWQYQMWQIINGVEPMFYIDYDGTTYMLVDGLQYWTGNTEYFRIPDDYPYWDIYHVTGDITSICGSINTIDVYLGIYQR